MLGIAYRQSEQHGGEFVGINPHGKRKGPRVPAGLGLEKHSGNRQDGLQIIHVTAARPYQFPHTQLITGGEDQGMAFAAWLAQ